MSFTNKNNRKIDLKCGPPLLGEEENFSLQITYNGLKQLFFYNCTLYLRLEPEGLLKRTVLKNYVKNHLKIFLI